METKPDLILPGADLVGSILMAAGTPIHQIYANTQAQYAAAQAAIPPVIINEVRFLLLIFYAPVRWLIILFAIEKFILMETKAIKVMFAVIYSLAM